MDEAHVDALSRWIAIRLPRRSLIAHLAALTLVAGHEPQGAEAKRNTTNRTRRVGRRRDRRHRRHTESLWPSLVPDVQGEVVGGTVVSQGTFNFAVFVQVNLGQGQFGACGGSLITPRHVLTAAHCVVDGATQAFLPGQFLTAIGRANIQTVPPANIREVSAVFKHPQYHPISIRNDVAILELASDVPASIAQPVALVGSNDTRFDSPGQAATVAGWGLTSGGGLASAQLLQAPLAVISDAVCGQEIELEPDVQICARNASASGCHGDSGGPLLVMTTAASAPGRVAADRRGAVGVEKKKKGKKKRKKGNAQNTPPPPPPLPPASPPVSPPPPVATVPVQLGVVSFGYDTCPPGGVNVFAQLSAPAVRSFIADVAGV